MCLETKILSFISQFQLNSQKTAKCKYCYILQFWLFSLNCEFMQYRAILNACFCDNLLLIDPSRGAWLTGHLANHNAESVILSDKQISQVSRLTLVDINLRKGVYWRLSMFETRYLLIDVHSCLVRALSKYEKMIGLCGAWTEAVICHDTLKSHKIVLLFEFLWNSMNFYEKLWLCFIPEVTCYVLSNCVFGSFLFAPRCIFYCIRTCVVWEWHGL